MLDVVAPARQVHPRILTRPDEGTIGPDSPCVACEPPHSDGTRS